MATSVVSDAKWNPVVVSEHVTDGPLAGLSAAVERRTLVAWDTNGSLYQIAARGEAPRRWSCDEPLRQAAISGDGRVVIACTGRSLHWLDERLTHVRAHRTVGDVVAAALDGTGWYAAISSSSTANEIWDCSGGRVAAFDSSRKLKFLVFLTADPHLVGAAEAGWLEARDMEGELVWRKTPPGHVGGLAIAAHDQEILLAGHGYGVLRFDARGEYRGGYQINGVPVRAAASELADTLLVATANHELLLVRRARGVVWTERFDVPIVGIALDPLGRSACFGLASGQVAWIDFFHRAARPPAKRSTTAAEAPARASRSQVRLIEPAWQVDTRMTEAELTSASMAMTDDPPRIGLLPPDRRLRVYEARTNTPAGTLHASAALEGIGRTILGGSDWLVALSDRRIVAYDASRNESRATPARFVEVTHAAALARGELVLVQERDRLTRARWDGKVDWVVDLRWPVWQMACAGQAIGVTTDSGELRLFRADGTPQAQVELGPGAHLLAALGETFFTSCTTGQVLCAHGSDGAVIWQNDLKARPWSLTTVGGAMVVQLASGAAVMVDTRWRVTESPASSGSPLRYLALANAQVGQLYVDAGYLTCASLAGPVLWRYRLSRDLGPIAHNRRGIAAIVGHRLCWFPSSDWRH